MPDLNAGSKVKGLDTPPPVDDAQAGQFTFTVTSYGVATTGGTYADCGVAFVAPTTGRVKISVAAVLVNSTAGVGTLISPVVREGGTIGSGTTVKAATDNDCLQVNGTSGMRTSVFVMVEGLTPGDTYNVRLEHRVTANTGTATRRYVLVEPLT